MAVTSTDEQRIREVIAIAKNARGHGNNPFGALLISAAGEKLAESENSQNTDRQVLAHAEMNLLHKAVHTYDKTILSCSTLYTSAEPCAMCAGAIFWSGVGRLVFSLRGERLHELAGFTPEMLVASASGVLAQAGRKVEVVGPVLEPEAEALFAADTF